jgi:hypothetical protein
MGTPAASFVEVASLDIFPGSFRLPVQRRWYRLLVLLSAGLASAGLALTFGRAVAWNAPLSLSVHEIAGQLRIGWSRNAVARGATLEILDGGRQTIMFVSSTLADVTYAARTADVQVRLTRSNADSRTEIARFLVAEPSITEMKARFASVFAEAQSLQAAMRLQSYRISNLESAAKELDRRSTGNTGRRTEATWWR